MTGCHTGMNVYVLLGQTEGRLARVIGVYDSREAAEEHRVIVDARGGLVSGPNDELEIPFDCVTIHRKELQRDHV